MVESSLGTLKAVPRRGTLFALSLARDFGDKALLSGSRTPAYSFKSQ